VRDDVYDITRMVKENWEVVSNDFAGPWFWVLLLGLELD
jgi:hypothetical protein